MDLALNNLQGLICHKTNQTKPYVEPYQVLPLQARVDLGAMAMKGYSAYLKAPALLEPHHQIV